MRPRHLFLIFADTVNVSNEMDETCVTHDRPEEKFNADEKNSKKGEDIVRTEYDR